jgi:hypothetical protein
MPDPTSTPVRTVRRARPQLRISRVSVEKTARFLVVKLPLTAVDYLNIEDSDELFAVPVNGVVQLSGFQPNLAIPVTRIAAEDFVEQPEE